MLACAHVAALAGKCQPGHRIHPRCRVDAGAAPRLAPACLGRRRARRPVRALVPEVWPSVQRDSPGAVEGLADLRDADIERDARSARRFVTGDASDGNARHHVRGASGAGRRGGDCLCGVDAAGGPGRLSGARPRRSWYWWSRPPCRTRNGLRPPTSRGISRPTRCCCSICLCAGVPRPRLTRAGTIATCVVLAIISATNAAQYDQHADVPARLGRDQPERRSGHRTSCGASCLPRSLPSSRTTRELSSTCRLRPLFSAEDAFGPFGYSPRRTPKAE